MIIFELKYFWWFSRRHRKSRRISENEATTHVNELKLLDETQSSCQATRQGEKHTQNGSDECWNATKESKVTLNEREENKHSIENDSVVKTLRTLRNHYYFIIKSKKKTFLEEILIIEISNLNWLYYVMSKPISLLYEDKKQFHKYFWTRMSSSWGGCFKR